MSSDPYSQIISGGLGTASTIVSTIGLDKSAKAEEEAAQAAALLIREQTLVDAARERRQNRKQLGQQRGQISRSGISLQGSQLDLWLDNARELELNAVYIERFGAEAAAQESARARSIGKAAQLGRAASIINSFNSGAQAAQGIYGATRSGSTVSRATTSQTAVLGDSSTLYQPDFNTGLGPGGG